MYLEMFIYRCHVQVCHQPDLSGSAWSLNFCLFHALTLHENILDEKKVLGMIFLLVCSEKNKINVIVIHMHISLYTRWHNL